MKRAYYYIFYKLYRYYEKGPSVWMSDWKAVLTLDILASSVFLSLFNYYAIYLNRNFRFDDNRGIIILTLFLTTFLPNHFIFQYKDRWKKILQGFQFIDKMKNRILGLVVIVMIILIFANLSFSYYLMSKVDWSQYK